MQIRDAYEAKVGLIFQCPAAPPIPQNHVSLNPDHTVIIRFIFLCLERLCMLMSRNVFWRVGSGHSIEATGGSEKSSALGVGGISIYHDILT